MFVVTATAALTSYTLECEWRSSHSAAAAAHWHHMAKRTSTVIQSMDRCFRLLVREARTMNKKSGTQSSEESKYCGSSSACKGVHFWFGRIQLIVLWLMSDHHQHHHVHWLVVCVGSAHEKDVTREYFSRRCPYFEWEEAVSRLSSVITSLGEREREREKL